MKHDIFFSTKDQLIAWLDENFPDARLTHVEADGAEYDALGCHLQIKGLHLIIDLSPL
jgi:hypothetical protein